MANEYSDIVKKKIALNAIKEGLHFCDLCGYCPGSSEYAPDGCQELYRPLFSECDVEEVVRLMEQRGQFQM